MQKQTYSITNKILNDTVLTMYLYFVFAYVFELKFQIYSSKCEQVLP